MNLFPTCIEMGNDNDMFSSFAIEITQEQIMEVAPNRLSIIEKHSVEWGSGVLYFGEELESRVNDCWKEIGGIRKELGEEIKRVVDSMGAVVAAQNELEGPDLNTFLNTRDTLNAGLAKILTSCGKYIQGMQNFMLCYQRGQQLLEIGAYVNPAIIDILKIQRLLDELLKFIRELGNKLRDTRTTLDYACANCTFQQPFSYETLKAFQSKLDLLERSIYERFALVVTEQPQQVIFKGKELVQPSQVRLLNFNNFLTAPAISLQVYLISESVAKYVRKAERLPDQLEIAGTIMLAGPASTDEVEVVIGRKKKRKPSEEKPYSAIVPYGVPNITEESGHTGMKIEFMCSPNQPCLDMTLHIKITEVVRMNRGCEHVANEKYCFLFAAELPLGKSFLKAWTISLPLVVTSHGSHNEQAWATIAWDNTFPAPGRKGFEVRKSADWFQFSEMLQSLFKKWVGNSGVMKLSHVDFIKHKLEREFCNTFPCISWSEITHEGDNLSFWCWFYRTVLMVRGPLNTSWDKGYIEGFISAEKASALLLNSNAEHGTFIVRFSDSIPGSISLIVIQKEGSEMVTRRITPLKLYIQKSFFEYCTNILKLLNSKPNGADEGNFRWVYPDISKEKAFEEFYQHSREKKEKSPYTGLCMDLERSASKVDYNTANNTLTNSTIAAPVNSVDKNTPTNFDERSISDVLDIAMDIEEDLLFGNLFDNEYSLNLI